MGSAPPWAGASRCTLVRKKRIGTAAGCGTSSLLKQVKGKFTSPVILYGPDRWLTPDRTDHLHLGVGGERDAGVGGAGRALVWFD